jgi:trypsin
MFRRAVVAPEVSNTASINNSTMEMGGMVYPNIVGGTLAPAGQYPWFAVLLDEDGDDYCGATLIHPRVLLTAGHCIEDLDFEKDDKGLGVIIGDVKRDPNNINEPAKYRTIVQSLLHPDYEDDENNNDFALLKLNLPVNTIMPITLNTNASIPAEGETLTIMGFGMTREVFGNSPTKLLQVNVSVISHAACHARYFFSGDAILEETMFCAGELFGGKDSCNGDSGGPAITANGVQVGVTRYVSVPLQLPVFPSPPFD